MEPLSGLCSKTRGSAQARLPNPSPLLGGATECGLGRLRL